MDKVKAWGWGTHMEYSLNSSIASLMQAAFQAAHPGSLCPKTHQILHSALGAPNTSACAMLVSSLPSESNCSLWASQRSHGLPGCARV